MRLGRFGVILLGLCGAYSASAASLEDIEKRGVLRACLSAIDPALVRVEPEGCTQECTFSGLIVDQVRGFANTLDGVTLAFREVGWSAQFADAKGVVDRASLTVPTLLEDGTCDLFASNLARLPWRLNKMEIVPLFESRMVVLTRSARLGDFADKRALAGKSVAVALNSSFHTWMSEQNAGEFSDNPIIIEALQGRDSVKLVLDQEVDFALMDADIAVFSMQAHPSDLAPAFAVGPVQQLGWGVAKNNTELSARIARFFEAERADNRSGINQAWLQHLNVSITEFEALIDAMGDPTGGDANGR